MKKLRGMEGISPRALEFAILTAARSGEVRHACWDEIDLEKRLWVVPAQKMKAGREHRVPLSRAAIALLQGQPIIESCSLIFPGTGYKGRVDASEPAEVKPMSDMSLSAVLKRMKLGRYTVHGFRSTFRDWASEHTHHSPESVEMALAHSSPTKSRLPTGAATCSKATRSHGPLGRNGVANNGAVHS